MAEKLKRAAAWLGLVTDDRYDDEDDRDPNSERTEGVSREDLVGVAQPQSPGHPQSSGHSPSSGHQSSGSHAASVTPLETRRTAPAHPEPTSSAPTPANQRAAYLSRIITVHPRTYNEARTIGEHFRDGVPVIMNLTEMEDVDAKRLVDFAAGLIFGLRGTIERVTSKVFLLSPQNVNVTAEDKERIVGGFFNQS
jgi:cell division inhibitor SepF